MAEAGSITSVEGLSVGPFVDELLRWLRPAAAVRIQNEYVRVQTDYVLAAVDREDVEARLDVLSGDAEFWRGVDRAWVPKPWQEAEAELSKIQISEEGMVAVLGVPAATRFLAGLATLKRVYGDANRFLEGFREYALQVGEAIAARAGLSFKPPPPQPSRPSDVADLLYDHSTPLLLRMVLASLLRWMAALVVMARVRDRAERLEPWLALELAECAASFPEKTAAMLGMGNLVAAAVPALLLSGAHAQRVAAAATSWSQFARTSDGIFTPSGDAGHEGR